MTQSQGFVHVGKVSEITNGQMKHVDINGKEVIIANFNGNFYAFDERCGHMNARLSNGNMNQNIVTCPFHSAKFDITTGKKVGEPILEIPPDMEPLPKSGKNIWSMSAKRCHLLKLTTRKHMKLPLKEIQ